MSPCYPGARHGKICCIFCRHITSPCAALPADLGGSSLPSKGADRVVVDEWHDTIMLSQQEEQSTTELARQSPESAMCTVCRDNRSGQLEDGGAGIHIDSQPQASIELSSFQRLGDSMLEVEAVAIMDELCSTFKVTLFDILCEALCASHKPPVCLASCNAWKRSRQKRYVAILPVSKTPRKLRVLRERVPGSKEHFVGGGADCTAEKAEQVHLTAALNIADGLPEISQLELDTSREILRCEDSVRLFVEADLALLPQECGRFWS
ncbi:hypothetical protein OPT61_g4741 [Boeremia exigua]|uniref:Uncharacterized protein n=1 Tax=Boeremia exigua TaxID=749465 RepID=A0ACC2ICV9_9PLEO|nr:hypothetical protein OPT61_g4741 [Boeremia exigua]